MKNRKKQKPLEPLVVDMPHSGNVKSAPITSGESFFVSKKDKKKIKIAKFCHAFIKYCVIFVAFLLLSNAYVGRNFAPFGVGFAFALLLVGENPICFGPFYVVSSLIVCFNIASVISALCVFAALVIFYVLSLLIKKNMPKFLVPLFELFGMAGYIYFNISNTSQILQTICYVILAILFLYICFVFLRALKGRGIFQGFTLDENICGALVVMAFSLGLFNAYIWEFSLQTMLVCFVMLCCSQIFGTKSTLYFCALAGFGLAFANKSLMPLAIFCSWAIVQTALGQVSRYVLAVGVLVADFLLGSYFQGYPVYTWVQALDVAIPCAIFCFIPQKVFKNISQKFEYAEKKSGIFLINFNREKTKDRLLVVSKGLERLGETYQKLGAMQNSTLDAKEQVAADVLARVCKNCENYNICMREKNMFFDIKELARCGIEKTRASLIDISNNVAANCTKISSLLSSVNYGVSSYAKMEKLIEAEDKSKVAIGEQLVATSKLLLNFSSEFSDLSKVNKELSDEIAEELLSLNIVAKDLVVIGDGENVTMVLKIDEKEEKIGQVLGKILKYQFVFESSPAKQSGYKIVHFKPAPRFDLSVGFATHERIVGINGDLHSVVELGDNKILLAICDGMGQGESAQNTSELVLDLVEDFYRAGFDSELILKNIAHVLSTNSKETFSTLDICVFDKTNGNCDFVKASAPPTAHRSGGYTTLIESESLPLGIVESCPERKMKMLAHDDVVVLASDGVYDSFANDDEYVSFINNLKYVNMNLFCESILEEARAKRGEINVLEGEETATNIPQDDMTVLAFKVL